MEKYFDPLIAWLQNLATTISLEVFVVVGSFLEEIIAPIPSPFVMTTAAVLAKAQSYSPLQITLLITLAALAKTASSYLIYIFADKAGEVVIGRFGKYFGVSHEKIEQIGQILSKSWWDDVLLFLSRAIPLIPTSVVTVFAGAMKYDVKSFLLMTFLGSLVRNLFYLWGAYFGLDLLQVVFEKISGSPILIAIVLAVLLGGLILLYRAKDSFWDTLTSKKK